MFTPEMNNGKYDDQILAINEDSGRDHMLKNYVYQPINHMNLNIIDRKKMRRDR